MAAIVLALFLAGQAASPQILTEVDKLVIQPKVGFGGPVPTERTVARALDRLVVAQPQRIVCIEREHVGSRIKRNQCATLQHWYDLNSGRNIPGRVAKKGNPATHGFYANDYAAPYELVNMITERYRSPSDRMRAGLRRAVDDQPTSRAEPPISNP